MKIYHENLERVRDYVLEEMAMMMLEPFHEIGDPFETDSDYYVVRARYKGVFKGALTVICQLPFADLLPKNLLGILGDESVSDSDRLDALKELTNVISGNFLLDAFGEETVFDLPEFDVMKLPAGEGHALLNDQYIYCTGDCAPFGICFEIDPE